MPVPRVIQRRQEFVEGLEEIREILDDGVELTSRGERWAGEVWKLYATAEMLAVRTYSVWESFSHDLLILTLAKDTSQLATFTGLSIKPKQVTLDMAEALLTSRGYLEFGDVDQLKSNARNWLVQSPFADMQPTEKEAANDLRLLRNFIVHRSRQSEQKYQALLQKRGVKSPVVAGEYLCDQTPTRLHRYVSSLIAAGPRLVP